MIDIIILSTCLWYFFFCLVSRYSFYNFNICRNPMLSLSKVVKRFSVHPPPQSLMFTKMIFKKKWLYKKITLSFCRPPALETSITNMKAQALGRYSISFCVTFPDPPSPGVSTRIVLPC